MQQVGFGESVRQGSSPFFGASAARIDGLDAGPREQAGLSTGRYLRPEAVMGGTANFVGGGKPFGVDGLARGARTGKNERPSIPAALHARGVSEKTEKRGLYLVPSSLSGLASAAVAR